VLIYYLSLLIVICYVEGSSCVFLFSNKCPASAGLIEGYTNLILFRYQKVTDSQLSNAKNAIPVLSRIYFLVFPPNNRKIAIVLLIKSGKAQQSQKGHKYQLNITFPSPSDDSLETVE